MHTSDLQQSDLEVQIAGAPVGLDDLWPDWDRHERLGVVVREPVGAVGASLLILSAMTLYYTGVRARGGALPCFADHYLFHVGRRWGDHNMLDVWPAQKEVVVPDAGEPLLEAIADRGVTRLAVPDDGPRGALDAVTPYALAAVRNRVVAAFAYARCGRVPDADVRITGTDETEAWVTAVVQDSRAIGGLAAEEAAAWRTALHDAGRPVEHYRRVPLDEALAALVV